MDKESMYKKIDQYLNNELEGVDLEEFERQLKEDKNLAKEVALIRDVEEAVEDRYLDTEFAPKLRKMGKEYFKEDKTTELSPPNINAITSKPTSNNRLTTILFVGSIIIGALLWIYFTATPTVIPIEQTTPEVETEQIFAANFQPYAVDNLQRSGTSGDSDYQTAIEAYQVKDYATAIPILEQALVATPNDSDIKMLLGNSYLGTKSGQAQAAVDLFKPLAADESSLYIEQAEWYLALAYLQNNQVAEAQALLEKIAAAGIGKYPKLAKVVLEQL